MSICHSTKPNFEGKEQVMPDDEYLMSWLETQVDAADAILAAAIQAGFGSDEHLSYSYVKLLCTIGDLEKAMYFLEERLGNNEKISQESFECVALSHARIGRMDIIEDIIMMSRQAGYDNGLSKHLMERIRRLQK